jgi:hypothetical protein
VGLGLIVWGYAQARLSPTVVWAPPVGLRHAALTLMLPVFPLLTAAYVPGRISRWAGGHPMLVGTLLWALAQESLDATDRGRLESIATEAARPDLVEPEVAALLAEARSLYQRGGVLPHAAAVAAEQRRLATEALAGCRLPRLREVLEFLLDLAVPEGASAS